MAGQKWDTVVKFGPARLFRYHFRFLFRRRFRSLFMSLECVLGNDPCVCWGLLSAVSIVGGGFREMSLASVSYVDEGRLPLGQTCANPFQVQLGYLALHDYLGVITF